jgi:ubiquinone/menaquinone biosynthesis C-methylase UbiE
MSQPHEPFQRVRGKGMYPHEYAGWLLSPLRNLILPASRLVRRLGLKPTDHVVEVGCGPGYFAPAVARAVPEGRVYLVDAQPEMIEMARARMSGERAANNVSFDVAFAQALPYAAASFDVVYMVTVLGEVPDQAGAMSEVLRVLKPGGRLSITEAAGDPDRLSASELNALTSAVGMRAGRSWRGPLIETFTYILPAC